MAKRFSDNIVADVFGRSFEPVEVIPTNKPAAGRVQMTVILDSASYDRVWDEVERRHREERKGSRHVQYGTSQLVAELVDEFLEADPTARDAYYGEAKKGDRRVGFRFPEETRERLLAECARRRREGVRRQDATVTSVIAAAIGMFLDGNEPDAGRPGHASTAGVDEFSAGLVF